MFLFTDNFSRIVKKYTAFTFFGVGLLVACYVNDLWLHFQPN